LALPSAACGVVCSSAKFDIPFCSSVYLLQFWPVLVGIPWASNWLLRLVTLRSFRGFCFIVSPNFPKLCHQVHPHENSLVSYKGARFCCKLLNLYTRHACAWHNPVIRWKCVTNGVCRSDGLGRILRSNALQVLQLLGVTDLPCDYICRPQQQHASR